MRIFFCFSLLCCEIIWLNNQQYKISKTEMFAKDSITVYNVGECALLNMHKDQGELFDIKMDKSHSQTWKTKEQTDKHSGILYWMIYNVQTKITRYCSTACIVILNGWLCMILHKWIFILWPKFTNNWKVCIRLYY